VWDCGFCSNRNTAASDYSNQLKERAIMVGPVNRSHLPAFLGLLLGSLVIIFWMIGPYLMALFLGGTLAMLTFPLYRWLRLKRWGPSPAALATTLFLLVLVIAPVAGFSVLAVRQGISAAANMPDLGGFSPQSLTRDLSRSDIVRALVGDRAQVNAQIKSGFYSLGQYFTRGVLNLAKGIPEFVLQIALAVIACFFFLKDGKRFVTWLLSLSPFHPAVQEKLIDTFRNTALSTLAASLVSSAIQATITALTFLAFGVPGAFLAGGASFILSWMPVVGSAPVWLAGAVYLFLQGAFLQMTVLLAVGVVAGASDNVVRAYMLRGQAAMHPLVGLVAVFGGISMFGILGVFIGPILAAMFIALLKLWPELLGRMSAAPAGASDKPAVARAGKKRSR
jgi:predicted PurR-regulated permease PerM